MASLWHVTELTDADPKGIKRVPSVGFDEALALAKSMMAAGRHIRISASGDHTNAELASFRSLGATILL